MKKALLNKKNLILILLAAIAIVAVAVVVFNSDASRKAEDGLSEKTADSDDELPESENGDQGEIYLDPQKKWEKENDAALRRRVETEHITGSAVAEIDSQTQPAEASPEAIVSVERAGYDMVVRGALISGYMNLLVYDGSGNIFDMIRTFSIDREFRMTNVPAGEYRIVVERPDIKGVSVSCLLKIYLELTKPELDLSNKISPSSRKIANPYGVSLIIEYGGESITIPAKSSSVVSFAEGSNDIVYYLKDENGVSEKIDAHITVDTTPPVVTLRNIKETLIKRKPQG
jgi:hypothetical protein